MRKSVRLLGLMAGTALVAFLGSSCAENALFAPQSDSVSSVVLDRALNAARVARENGDLNSAASKLAYLVSIAPENADVLSEYGKVLTEMGKPDEALAYFGKAKALNADDWKLYNAEGVAYDEKRDFEASRADYAKALQLNPSSTAVLNNAARSRMMANDLVGAEALLAQARPTAQEDGYFRSTQAQLSALELKSNPNAPVAALTPDMAVQAPAMPPEPARTLPVEVQNAEPVASRSAVAGPRALSTAAQREATLENRVAPSDATALPTTTNKAPSAANTPAVPPVAPAVASTPTVAAITPPPEDSTQSTPVAAPTSAETPTAPEAPAAARAVSAPVAPAIEKAAVSTTPAIEPASPVPSVEKNEAAPITSPAVAAAPVVEAKASPAPALETAESAPAVQVAMPALAVEATNSAPPAIEPAATASATPVRPALSVAAQREAALEAGVAPPAISPATAAAVQTPSTPAAAPVDAASMATTEKLYIRVGMFRSRTHARHVAARLRPHDVHVTRLTWHGRDWYRVWIRGVGARPEVQDELASVHSLGYLHARIIAKVETGRHLAQNSPTVVASSGQ